MNRTQTTLLLGIGSLVLATGCKNGGPDEPTPAAVHIDLGGDYAEDDGQSFPGFAGIPNLDDDDRNGAVDWTDEGDVDDENDLATLYIQPEVIADREEGASLRLRLEAYGLRDDGPEHTRIWHDGEVVLGENGGEVETSFDVLVSKSEDTTIPSAALEFDIEFEDFLTASKLVFEHFDADGELVSSEETYITASPLVMNHHLQPAEHTWVVEASYGGSANTYQMIGDYEDRLGDDFTAINGPTYGSDVWIQDEIEFATLTASGLRMDVVIDSIRNRGLDNMPEDMLEGPDFIVGTWGSGQANSLDSFGNLEASPPVTVDGRFYPFGRIYHGGNSGYHMTDGLTEFLDSQDEQRPFQVDTTWLIVGHVDEFQSFVPDASSEKGFRWVWTDIDLSYELLEAMDPNMALPKYAPNSSHNIDTVGEMVEDNALRALNEDIRDDILIPLREQYMEELGMVDADVISMPGNFDRDGFGDSVAALVPGMANLIVFNKPGEDIEIFLADPFMRNSDDSHQGQEDDSWIAWIEDNYPAELNWNFVDDFSVYHLALGEVHCGTNVTRTPTANWWTDGGHLVRD